jgi:hypothetical protein
MRRLRILLLSIVVTAVVLAARYVVHDILRVNTDLAWDDIQVVVTGASLIIGLMLVGVLRDYGDAGQLPGTVASGLSALDHLLRNAGASLGLPPTAYLAAVEALTDAITEWLYGRAPDSQIRAQMTAIRRMLLDMHKAGISEGYVIRAHIELSALDASVARMMSIRNSAYLQSGYTLMYLLTTIVIMLLLVVEFTSSGLAPWLMSGSLTLIYAYLVLLIRDLDNPFAYGRRSGVAEVDLAPLLAVGDELHSRG